MVLLLFYLGLALLVSFVCSIVEAVILSVTAPFIKMKELEGKASALHLRNLKNKIDRPLSAILTINTIAHTVGAAGVGAQAVAVFGEVYFGMISGILTLLILFLSEIIPKTIGAVFWRQLAVPSTFVIIGMIYISYPLVVVSEFVTRAISKKKKSQSVTRDEVAALAHLGKKEGVFKESESRIIDNLIKLNTFKVKDIMTPRTVVVAAPEDIPIEVFIKKKNYLQYSRIPVYSGTFDNITGYVLKSDVLEKVAKGSNRSLIELRRPVLFFFENFSVPKVFEELLLKKEHAAMIVDEYGGIQGLVTMEDIIETLIGSEIMDEKDFEANMQKLAKERWELRKQNLKVGEE